MPRLLRIYNTHVRRRRRVHADAVPGQTLGRRRNHNCLLPRVDDRSNGVQPGHADPVAGTFYIIRLAGPFHNVGLALRYHINQRVRLCRPIGGRLGLSKAYSVPSARVAWRGGARRGVRFGAALSSPRTAFWLRV